ncbi:MAG: malate dehydrogenase [Janthinobacterium lividum]
MDISVIGAGGAIGREIVAQLVSGRVLKPTERLQLVGKRGGASERMLYGLRSDLTDAYAENAPQMDIALGPEEVVGDVIVMAAGATPGPSVGGTMSRDDVAHANLPVFAAHARALAQHGQGHEVVIMVTNPVELGVAVMARELGARRVIGIGAYSDSLRFRREIAADLGIPRQLVSGYVAGEHGTNLVPLWSSVRVYGLNDSETATAVQALRGNGRLEDFPARVAAARESIQHLVLTETRTAFDAIETLPPDIRVQLRPELTHLSGSRTVMATANVTVDMVRQMMAGREMSVAGQVMLEGEGVYGIRGVLGVPLLVSNQGVVRVLAPPLWQEEGRALHEAAAAIAEKIKRWQESKT